jgi:glutathione reductase (NADPH)
MIVGNATFTADKTVEVDGDKYTADHILIATGGRPIIPNITGEKYLVICLHSILWDCIICIK